MKQILLAFFVLLMVSSPLIGGTPHMVTGKIFNHDASVPDDGTITFSAYITSRSSEVQTQNSTGNGYSSGYWYLGAGNFSTAWSVGDVLHVDFTNTATGVTGSINYTLTSTDPDMAPDVTLSAIQYQLTMAVNPAGGGTTAPTVGVHSYDDGTVVNISATPAAGYRFVKWIGGVADSSSASTTVTMSANKTVTASFQKTYNLTMAVNPAGGGTTTPTSGVTTYDDETIVSISSTPSTGYRFVKWTGGVADSTSASTTVTMNANKTVTAHFVVVDTLTMVVNPVSEGTTSPAIGIYTYDAGTVVNITATANSGYAFSNWTGEVANPNSASTTVTMNSNKTVTANFVTEYTLTMAVNPANSGTTTPSVGDHNYGSGNVVNISASPAAGYRFVKWPGGVADSNNSSTTVTISTNKIVTANFQKTYNLTMAVSPTGGATTTPAIGVHTYDDGTVVNISTTPSKGYQFVKWTGGVADSTSVSTTVTMNANKTVTANFMAVVTIDTLNMAVIPAGEGTTTPAIGVHTYNDGTVVNISATPAAGYHFASWIGGVVDSTNNSTNLIMNSNKNVAANFGFVLTVTIDSSEYADSITISPKKAVYLPGDKVILIAYAKENCVFLKWSGDVSDTISQVQLIMDKDKTVHALFGSKSLQPPSGIKNDPTSVLPKDFSLSQNYPNPFNPSTQISFALPKDAQVTLEIYNTLGTRIRTLLHDIHLHNGVWKETWDGLDEWGKGVTTGMYFYRLKAGSFIMTKKMIMMR